MTIEKESDGNVITLTNDDIEMINCIILEDEVDE